MKDYLVKEVALKLGVTTGRVLQLIEAGRLLGAYKRRGCLLWWIPAWVVDNFERKPRGRPRKPPQQKRPRGRPRKTENTC